MTTTLDQDLTAAGFIPVPSAIEGVVAWTGWRAPDPGGLGAETPSNVYEMYYDLCTAAMYAQLDNPPWERRHWMRPIQEGRSKALGPACTDALMDEYRAVVACWAQRVPGAACGGPLMNVKRLPLARCAGLKPGQLLHGSIFARVRESWKPGPRGAGSTWPGWARASRCGADVGEPCFQKNKGFLLDRALVQNGMPGRVLRLLHSLAWRSVPRQFWP